MKPKSLDTTGLVPVRCPYCNRLAAEVSEGASVRVKCGRCGRLFELDAGASATSRR
jgi:phage FluMu protein Com